MTLGSHLHDAIAITGIGCLSAAGEGVEVLWNAALRGRGLACSLAADRGIPVCAVPPFDLEPEVRRSCRGADRMVTLGLCAAVAAARDAGLDPEPGDGRTGVFAGTSRGPVSVSHAIWQRQSSHERLQPSGVALGMTGSLSGTLAMHFKSAGPVVTVSTGCTSAATAMASAADHLLLGRIDFAIAGGAEAPLHPVLMRQFESLGMLDLRDAGNVCRPFDADRAGTVLGEGAAFFVMERLSTARARKAAIHGILSGWAMASDTASSRAAACPFGSGLSAAILSALGMAGMDVNELGWISAHGTGTLINDGGEAAAYRRIGAANARVPVSSTKPVTGHCLGASPALESALCLAALRHRKVPPTPNLSLVDPACAGPEFIIRPMDLGRPHVMNANQGFFGVTSALCFSEAR